MSKNIEPKLKKIGDYLKLEEDTVFTIPEYQRAYSWGIDNCDKLWQDINDFVESESKDRYFFGTIIINCQDNDTKYGLIDGQQRTTTFLLLLKALLVRINIAIERTASDEDSASLCRGLQERRRRIMGILYKAETEDISDKPDAAKDSEICHREIILENFSINEQYKTELSTILQATDYASAEARVIKIKYKQKDNRYTNFFRNFKFFYGKISELSDSQLNSIASRGRLSYLTPGRTKPITARKLGDDFDKAAVLAALDKNAQRTKTQATPKHSAPSTQKRVQQQDTVSRMVDIEAKRAEGKGQGYIHWAKLHNLKNGSKAFMMYKEMGFESSEELETVYQEAHEKMTATLAKLKSVEAVIAEKKELRTHVLNYFKTKDIREGLKACKNEKARRAYREEHDSDFIILDAAKRYFDSKGLKKLPSYKALQAQIEQLIKEKNALYNEYHEAKDKDKELGTVRHNIDQILNGELSRKQEQEI